MTSTARSLVSLVVTALLLAWPAALAARQPFAGLIDVPGSQVYAAADGDGEAVLLVHGGFMDSDMWADEVAAFKDRFRVIRFDLRGYGRSPVSPRPYSPLADMAAVLDRFGVERAHLVGISMGGGLAIDFALAHPDRVISLVLAEPGVSGWRWSADVMDTMAAVSKVNAARGRAAAIDEFLSRPVFATSRDKPRAFAAIRAQLERNFTLESPRMTSPERPALDRLREIQAPTLVLAGEHGGPDAGAITVRIQREVPGARRVVVAGSGHMINFEQPAEFQRVVRDFLVARQ